MARAIAWKVVVGKHPEGYVGYPLGLKSVVVGEGNSYEKALQNVTSTLWFHIETLGLGVLPTEPSPVEAFGAEVTVEKKEVSG